MTRRVVTVLAMVVLAASIGAVTMASPVSAAGTGTLSGTVRDPSAVGIGGLTVEALNWYFGATVATTSTNPDGTYSFDTLPVGGYRIRVHDPAGTWPDRYSGNSADWAGSSAVTVTEDTTTTVDLDYPAGDTIEGTVTDGAVPLAGIFVELLGPDGWADAAQTTGPDGSYNFTNLAAGPYAISFSDPGGTWAAQYNGGVNSFDSAPKVNVVGNTTHTIDQTMLPAGSLTGTVTIGDNPPDLTVNDIPSPAGMIVVVLDATNAAIIALGITQPDGTWTIGALPPGAYRVGIADPAFFTADPSTGYRPVFIPDADINTQGLFAAFFNATAYALPLGGTIPTGVQELRGWDCDPTTLTPGSDLSNVDLSGANLRGCDLAGATFAKKDPDNSLVAATSPGPTCATPTSATRRCT